MSNAWPPSGAEPLVSFRVQGMPKGAGSKNVIPLGRRDPKTRRFKPHTRPDGTPIFNVQDSTGEAGDNWRADVRAAAAVALDAAHELADGPLAVRVTFAYAGPRGRYGTGRNEGVLKASADRYPHAGELSDGTKLARALEDALTGLVWTDDRRVVDLWWSRQFIDQLAPAVRERLGNGPGAVVDIFALPVKVSDAGDGGVLFSLESSDQGVIMDGDGDGNETEVAGIG